MTRAFAKGSVQWCFGRCPGGSQAYRWLTRVAGGTQATHVDKLARVVPGYFQVWNDVAGVDLESARVGILEPGYTPFWPIALYLATGRGGSMFNSEARMLDRYVNHAVDTALRTFPRTTEERRSLVANMSRERSLEVVRAAGSSLHQKVDMTSLPCSDGALDVVHSGGIMEHFQPRVLRRVLAECLRVLAPNGVASHVFDHRDHLYHSDKSVEPMNHLRYGRLGYGLRYGHRLAYHNRLSPAEVQGFFAEVGFELIATRRMVLPGQEYVADEGVMDGLLGCSRVHAEFANWSDMDLRTAACHYLFRRPA